MTNAGLRGVGGERGGELVDILIDLNSRTGR